MTGSLNPQEIEHFSKDSANWWDEKGPFRPLHRLNPLRLRYIRDRLAGHFGLDAGSLSPFRGLSVLDVGCGGGLVCEPMARLGAQVTGIDADAQAVAVAKDHAEKSGLKINYECTTAEALLLKALPPAGGGLGGGDSPQQQKPDKISQPIHPPTQLSPRRGEGFKGFDAVLALEIVEHVADRDFFIRTCARLCRPGGVVIFSTLNRTPKSFALGIIAAEHILRWVARGTHDWKKFVRPSELAASGRRAGLAESNVEGYGFNPLAGQFEMTGRNLAVNYFMTFEKPGDKA